MIYNLQKKKSEWQKSTASILGAVLSFFIGVIFSLQYSLQNLAESALH